MAIVTPAEVGEGRIELLVSNGFLGQSMKNNCQAVGKPCLTAHKQWAVDHGGLEAP